MLWPPSICVRYCAQLAARDPAAVIASGVTAASAREAAFPIVSPRVIVRALVWHLCGALFLTLSFLSPSFCFHLHSLASRAPALSCLSFPSCFSLLSSTPVSYSVFFLHAPSNSCHATPSPLSPLSPHSPFMFPSHLYHSTQLSASLPLRCPRCR